MPDPINNPLWRICGAETVDPIPLELSLLQKSIAMTVGEAIHNVLSSENKTSESKHKLNECSLSKPSYPTYEVSIANKKKGISQG